GGRVRRLSDPSPRDNTMARNKTVDTSEERNDFILELLRQDPGIRSAEVQEKLKSKFGSTVSSRVLNQLREQIQTEAETEETTSEPLFEPAPAKEIELPAEAPTAGTSAPKAARP